MCIRNLATQYIAPFMAKFDAIETPASIMGVIDNKTRMLISWNNVSLHDNREGNDINVELVEIIFANLLYRIE
jgi:hypothetical protein